METYIFLAIGLASGFALGFLFARNKTVAGPSVEAAEREVALLREQLIKLEDSSRSEADARKAEVEAENRILQVLAPVTSNINDMKLKVAELEKERTNQFKTIEEQLRNTIETENSLKASTVALANVMSNNQLRGRWGELQLKRVMESAGMMHNVDYFTQVQTVNDEGLVIKPDAAINMPDGRFVAVDAKTPFNNYDRALAISTVGTDEENRERTALLKKHATDVKHHIDEISKKNYFSGMPSSPEFTLMFLPSESILSVTLEHDPGLMEYAFSKRVALVSPVSFFSSVKAIAYTWQQSAQEATVQDIIALGVKLHKNVRVVASHLVKLGNSLKSSVTNFNNAVSSLERNLLTSTRDLNSRANKILDQGDPIPNLIQVIDGVASFTKPELTSDSDDDED